MQREYVALLRAISNVGMQPFREAMEELGFRDVESYGMSGNLLFNAAGADPVSLEGLIANRLGAATFVRTRAELTRVVARDPFHGRSGASMLFLARPPSAPQRRNFIQLEFEAESPVLRGRTVYFVYPARLRGKRTPLDFERVLGVLGTARSARMVGQLLGRMAEPVRDNRRVPRGRDR